MKNVWDYIQEMLLYKERIGFFYYSDRYPSDTASIHTIYMRYKRNCTDYYKKLSRLFYNDYSEIIGLSVNFRITKKSG